MTIKEIQEEIIDEFSMFDDWMERYEYIIDLGKSLPIINEAYKLDSNLISGCQSKVWLHSEIEDKTINFTADSDAILTKGIVALLLRVFNNQKPSDILLADLYFVDQIGLKDGGIASLKDGGMLNFGGREMDLRTGGFVPIGRKERADDVPARLSKNE